MNRLSKFWSLTQREKRLLGESGVLLVLSTLALRIFHFKRIYNFLSDSYGTSETATRQANDDVSEINLIKLSISRVANGLPWRSLCLSRSIVGFVMLRRRGIPATLFAGAKILENSSLVAHAWINIGNEENEKILRDSDFAVVVRIGQMQRELGQTSSAAEISRAERFIPGK
jgi:hypothetical protein